jgi:lipoprotein-releasing system permease protein
LFAALKWEKLIMTIIVFLFIIAALVGVIVSTSNVIRTRKKDIGILKSIGASDHDILFVFTLLGFISGLAGTILGVAFGIFTAMKLEMIIGGLESLINTIGGFYCQFTGTCLWIHSELMPKDVYYFDKMPVSIDSMLIHPLSILAIFLSGLAALIPAWSAGKLQPMDIIRSSDL